MVRRNLTGDEIQRYTRDSLCSSSEIKRLWTRFQLLDTDERGYLTKDELMECPEICSNPFGGRMVDLFSRDGDGCLTFQQLLEMYDVFHAHAPQAAKIAWAFAIWDFDGDDRLDAGDLRTGLQLLANGGFSIVSEVAAIEQERRWEGVPPMFEETEAVASPGRGGGGSGRRKSVRAEMLTPHETSQILQCIAAEVEPAGAGISFQEFEGVVGQLPEFLSNFRINL